MNIRSSLYFTASLCLSTTLLLPAIGTNSAEAAASLASSHTALQQIASIPTLQPLWTVETNEQGLFAKQSPISNGLVFFTDSSDVLHAADFETGKIKWSIPQAGTPEVITSNSVTFLDPSGRLVKVDSSSGKILWQTAAVKGPNEIGAHVYTAGNLLLVLDENSSGGLSAFDPVSGQRKWHNSRISMYAGELIGQYGKTLVASSTVDNIRTQLFGIDAATGKQIWRQEGIYTPIGQEKDRIILREVTDQASRLAWGDKAFRGYMLRLAVLDLSTGKIVKKENYGLSQDARSSADSQAYFTDHYVYGVETSLSPDLSTLVRYERGKSATAKSYAEYGDLVSGLENGYFFFQKDGILTALHAKDDHTLNFGKLPAHVAVTGVRVSGTFAFAGLDNGEYYIFDMQSGRIRGMLPTKSHLFSRPFVKDEKVLVQILNDLIVLNLPKS